MSSNLESSVQRKLQGTSATVHINLGRDSAFTHNSRGARVEVEGDMGVALTLVDKDKLEG